jgi:protein-tyrosine phosphatase
MIDLHCHILPGIDDGPRTLEDSLKMARFFIQDGIRFVAATPHCHRSTHLLRADILPHVAWLNQELKSRELPLTILPGSEIRVTDTADYRREFERGLFCHLGDGRSFTLLEFSWAREQFPPDAVALVSWIGRQGLTPILAHPERHNYFHTEPSLLDALVEAGAWVQITVDSLLGNHGAPAKKFGDVILRKYPSAILATDAHNMNRCSGLSPGYKWVTENLGRVRADDLRDRADQILAALLTPASADR